MRRIEPSFVPIAAVAALLLAGCEASPPPAAPVAPVASATPVAPKAHAGATVKIGEKDGGKTIEAHAGDTVELTLTTNPSTGYDWQVDAVDRTLGQPTIARADGANKAVGAATTMTFTWKLGVGIADPSDHKVELAYRRPWEKGEPPDQTFKFTLHVVP